MWTLIGQPLHTNISIQLEAISSNKQIEGLPTCSSKYTITFSKVSSTQKDLAILLETSEAAKTQALHTICQEMIQWSQLVNIRCVCWLTRHENRIPEFQNILHRYENQSRKCILWRHRTHPGPSTAQCVYSIQAWIQMLQVLLLRKLTCMQDHQWPKSCV